MADQIESASMPRMSIIVIATHEAVGDRLSCLYLSIACSWLVFLDTSLFLEN